jgi:hypothetical protein
MIKNSSVTLNQKNTITVILLFAAAMLLIIGSFAKEVESKRILNILGIALLFSAFIFRRFYGRFGYKPSRE